MISLAAQLWIPGKLPGLNDLIAAAKGTGGRGIMYAKLKREWTSVVWAEAKRQRLPAFPGRVVMAFRWLEEDKRRDPDNVAAGGRKLINDGLVLAGVLKGDGWRFMQSWTDRFAVASSVPGAGGPGVEVTIHDYPGAVGM